MEFWENIKQVFEQYPLEEYGFCYGVAFTVLLYLILRTLAFFLFSKKCTGITVDGKAGSLLVTTHALEDFIIRTLSERDDLTVKKLKLHKSGSRYKIDVMIEVPPHANVTELHPIIEEMILQSLESRIGITSIKTINILLKNFSASERTIKKRQKLAEKNIKAIEAPEENETQNEITTDA